MTFNNEAKFLYINENFKIKSVYDLKDGLKPCTGKIITNFTEEFSNIIDWKGKKLSLKKETNYIDSKLVLLTSDDVVSVDSEFIIVAKWITPSSVFAGKEIYAVLMKQHGIVIKNGIMFILEDDGEFRPGIGKHEFVKVSEHRNSKEV